MAITIAKTLTCKFGRIFPSFLLYFSLVIFPPILWAENQGESPQCLKPEINWENYQWVLLTGKGYAPCDEMFSYLQSWPADKPPPVCPEERVPAGKNWRRPVPRLLSKKEQKYIIQNSPINDQCRDGSPAGYLRGAKAMYFIEADITRDNIDDKLLLVTELMPDECEKSKRCADTCSNLAYLLGNIAYTPKLALVSSHNTLYPMTRDGKKIDWNNQAVKNERLLINGEFVFYKNTPYWVSGLLWDQLIHDNYKNNTIRPDNPDDYTFTLAEIRTYDKAGDFARDIAKNESKKLEDVVRFLELRLPPDTPDTTFCRFGYFRKDQISLYNNPGRK